MDYRKMSTGIISARFVMKDLAPVWNQWGSFNPKLLINTGF
jgi:hypothetical protein